MYSSQDYFNEVTNYLDFKKLSNEKVDSFISKLLRTLPRSKRLFKYRKFNSPYFKEQIESLNEGYIYIPVANELNDKIDCSFNYRELRDESEIREHLIKSKYKIHYYYLTTTNDKSLTKNLNEKLNVLSSLIECDDDIKAAKAIKNGSISLINKIRFVSDLKNEVSMLVENNDYIKRTIQNFNILGEKVRGDVRVFSLCESCNQDSMWAYYSNDNKGYCIEYNFNLLKKADYKTKRLFLSFYKVIYNKKREPIDPFDLFDVVYQKNKNTKKGIILNKRILKSFITKSVSWKHEKEWRLLSENENEKIYVDLISGIVIDEDVVKSKRAKILINLAKSKSWSIKIRTLNQKTNSFEIINYNG